VNISQPKLRSEKLDDDDDDDDEHNNNNNYYDFSASQCTPFNLFFSVFVSTVTVKDITYAHSEHNKAIIGRQKVQESRQSRPLRLIRSNRRKYSSADKR